MFVLLIELCPVAMYVGVFCVIKKKGGGGEKSVTELNVQSNALQPRETISRNKQILAGRCAEGKLHHLLETALKCC